MKNDLKENKKDLRKLLTLPSESDFIILRGRMDQNEKTENQLRKSIFEIEKKIKQMRVEGSAKGGQEGGDPKYD